MGTTTLKESAKEIQPRQSENTQSVNVHETHIFEMLNKWKGARFINRLVQIWDASDGAERQHTSNLLEFEERVDKLLLLVNKRE